VGIVAGKTLPLFVGHMGDGVFLFLNIVQMACIAEHGHLHYQLGLFEEYVGLVAGCALFLFYRHMYGIIVFGFVLKVTDEARINTGEVRRTEVCMRIVARLAALVCEFNVTVLTLFLIVPVTRGTKAALVHGR
jgi:hypothetical protein